MTSATNPIPETSATPRAQLEALLASVVRLGSASVCLMAGHAPLVRVQGALVQTNEPALTASKTKYDSPAMLKPLNGSDQ